MERLLSAVSHKGLGNYGVIERLRDEFGKAISIISDWASREWGLKASSVIVTTPDFTPGG